MEMPDYYAKLKKQKDDILKKHQENHAEEILDMVCAIASVELIEADEKIEAKDAEIAGLNKQLQRWADAHDELTTEVELRCRIALLETFIESRGYEVPE